MQTVSRLIQHFVPDHYNLSLAIKREARTFSGTVDIDGQLVQGDTILLHAKDLTIATILVDGKEANWSSGENDEISIRHPDITPGKHLVTIGFSGTITDAMHGMYPCYFTHDGIKKELIATQLESHHAREVFPCVDEPEAKATFDVTLTTDSGITVLGNMPIKQQTTTDGQLVTTFDTTPRMSTYLLAWVAGELHKKTAKTKSGVEVNVWATPAQQPDSLDFALDIATRTIDFFDEYFGTKYPLPKSDHVALPDFSSGAMENWGLVTYREIALLADPATTSISSKHYIATVVAHELSHQWFGNLVTMKWWNNLWLNESFATIMEYIAIDALHPEWNIWLDFATMESIIALRRDSLEGVQPVQTDVNHPDEISTLFDSAIVYAKGARLLRMLQTYLGDEAFQAGLKSYFAKYAYKNTEADDLWNEFAAASGKDIQKFMSTWISQSGYPMVSLDRTDSQLTIAQEQFFTGPHHDSNRIWPIPLGSAHPDVPELLNDRHVEVTLTSEEPIQLNRNDTAHFLTRYQGELLDTMIDSIAGGDVSTLGRLQFLHEQTLLARAGYAPSRQLIPLLDAYKRETAEPVWDILALAIGELKKFTLDDETSEQNLHQLAARVASKQYQRLGWSALPNEPEEDTKLRATIIGLMLFSEDADVTKTALAHYNNTPLEHLNPELRSPIISAAVRHSEDLSVVESLLARYPTISSPDLQMDVAAGLTSTKNQTTIARLLNLIKDPAIVRPQDAFRWFIYLLRNRDGRALAWQWLQTNWQWIEDTFAGDKSYDDFPHYAANSLMTRQELDQYIAFFGSKQSIPALARTITLGIAELQGRVELIERDQQGVRDELATATAHQ